MVGWFAAWAVIFTWPVAAHLSSRIIGDEYSGAWRTLWAHDWTLHRLLTAHRWPLDAPEIAFPRGGAFSSIAPVNDFLSLLPQVLFGLVAAYNLVVLFHLVLAGTGGYALARVAGLGRAGALVAGTVFGFNAFLLTYGVASAVVETSTMGWMAWFLTAVLWLVRHPCLRTALASGLLFAIAGVASFYWALHMALLAPVVALPALWDRWRQTDRLGRRRLVLAVAGAIVVATVAFAPPARSLMATYTEQGAVLKDYATRKQIMLDPQVMAGLVHDFATAASYLVPGRHMLAVHEDMDRLVRSTYAGWVALVLASFGLARGRWRWLVLGLGGAALSLGPFLFLSVDSYRSEPVWWWRFLRSVLPPIRMITSYVRFSVWFYMGLAVLAGGGADLAIRRLAAHLPLRFRPLLALVGGPLLATAVLAETILVSPVPWPLPSAQASIPEASYALAKLSNPGAVLDWPQRYPNRSVEVSRYFFYASVHHRPIPYDFAPTSYMPGPIEDNAFFARLEKITYGPAYNSGAWDAETFYPIRLGLLSLKKAGFAYLVLHPEHIAPPRRIEVLEGWLDSLLMRAKTLDDGGVIYTIEEPDDWRPRNPLAATE